MPLESEKKKRETNVCDVRDLKIVAGYNNDTRRMKWNAFLWNWVCVFVHFFFFFFLHRTENGLRMPSNKNQTSDIKEHRFFFIFIKSLAFFVRFVMLNKNNVRSGDFSMGCLFACASMHFWNFVLISNKREWKNWFLHFKRNKFHFLFSSFLPLLVILLVWLSSFWALAWVWIKISNKRKFNGYTVCVCFLMCDATLDIPNVLFHVF